MLWFPYLQYTLLAPPTWISSLSSEFVIKSLYGFLIKIGSRKTLSPRKAGDVRALSLLCLPDVTGGLARSGIWQLLVVKGSPARSGGPDGCETHRCESSISPPGVCGCRGQIGSDPGAQGFREVGK